MSDQPDEMAQSEVSEEQEVSTQKPQNQQSTEQVLDAKGSDAVDSISEDATVNQDVAPLKTLDEPAASACGGAGMAGVQNGQTGGHLNMDSLMDVPVTLSVEIGRKRMPINQLVNLSPGAIVDLNRDLDAPLDLLVNGTLIARGEVVVMGKKFGLRLVDICSPNERVRGLTQ